MLVGLLTHCCSATAEERAENRKALKARDFNCAIAGYTVVKRTIISHYTQLHFSNTATEVNVKMGIT